MNFKFDKYFSNIYKNNVWGCGSGGGSTIENTVEYRRLLGLFLEKNSSEITNIIDYGCGDWQSSKLISWEGFQYLGIDCVDFLIEQNEKKYSSKNVDFKCLYNFKDFYSYTSDLLILKDVIQHWTNQEIKDFFDNIIKNHKFILITNSCSQKSDWQDEPYRSRPLTAKMYPLKAYNPVVIANYSSRRMPSDKKEVSLIKNDK